MLADAGATAVIVGHSERRTTHHETDAQVRAIHEQAPELEPMYLALAEATRS